MLNACVQGYRNLARLLREEDKAKSSSLKYRRRIGRGRRKEDRGRKKREEEIYLKEKKPVKPTHNEDPTPANQGVLLLPNPLSSKQVPAQEKPQE